jgi:hypothetical protein
VTLLSPRIYELLLLVLGVGTSICVISAQTSMSPRGDHLLAVPSTSVVLPPIPDSEIFCPYLMFSAAFSPFSASTEPAVRSAEAVSASSKYEICDSASSGAWTDLRVGPVLSGWVP